MTSRGRFRIDLGLWEGHFGDQNDDFLSLGSIWGVLGLPWAPLGCPALAQGGQTWFVAHPNEPFWAHFWDDLELFDIQKVRK